MRAVKLFAAAMSVLGSFGGVVFAEDEGGIGFELTADYFNKYIWRGQSLVDDWVFRPGVSVGYGGLTASFWGNMDLTNENTSNGEFSEVDLTLDYSASIPGIDILGYSVGLIHYDFPVNGSADDTSELYAGVSLDVPASPSVTFYYDVDEVKDGMYISFGVGHSFEEVFELGTNTPVGVDLSASLGWANGVYNKGYWGAKPDGTNMGGKANDLVLTLAFPFQLAGFDVTTSLNYVTLVSDDIRKTDAYGRGRDDSFYAGISLPKAF